MAYPVATAELLFTMATYTNCRTFICKCARGITVYFIRLEAKFPPNIGITLGRDLAVFTHSALATPKANRFG